MGLLQPQRQDRAPHGNQGRAWKRLKTAAGITDPQVIPYTLRHTLASNLGISGANQAVIAAALGHANSRTSERYTHLNIDPVRAALAGVNAKMLTGGTADETQTAN